MIRLFIPLLLLAVMASGCVTRRTTMDDVALSKTRLFVTRSADLVTLSWESEPNLAYTVMYNHTRSARSPWQILPGFDFIRGTGRTITYQDRVPVGEERYYRLQLHPAVSLGR